MLKLIRNLIAAVIFVLIGILLASNYEIEVLEVSDKTTATVMAKDLIGKVALDFKFLNKHVVVLKK